MRTSQCFLLFPQAKHLQFVSGVDAVSFWLATYSWDLINYLIPMIGIVIMFAAFQVDSLKNDLGAIVLLLVIIIYSAAVLSVMVSRLCFDPEEEKHFFFVAFLCCSSAFNCPSLLFLVDLVKYFRNKIIKIIQRASHISLSWSWMN